MGGYEKWAESIHFNIASVARPLIVNCTGTVDLNCPFTTDEPQGRHDHYLMVMTGGCLDALVGGKRTVLMPGMTILFPPEQAYRYSRVGDEPVKYLWAHFTGSYASELLRSCGLADCGIWQTGLSEALLYALHQLRGDFIRRNAWTEVSSANHLAAALIEAGKLASGETEAVPDERLSASIQYIHQSFSSELSASALAEMEHLSVPRYNVLFRKMMGTSPRRYITGLRLENACELLLSTDLCSKQIARLVGYTDPHYFSRAFRQQYGMSPEKYRLSAQLKATDKK